MRRARALPFLPGILLVVLSASPRLAAPPAVADPENARGPGRDGAPDALAVTAALDSLEGARRDHVLGIMNGDLDALARAAAARDRALDVLAQAALTPIVVRQLPWPLRVEWLEVALSERRDDWCHALLEGLNGTPPPPGSASRGEGALALALCAERLLEQDPEEAAGYLKGDPDAPLSQVASAAFRVAAGEDFLLRDEALYHLWRLADGEGDSIAALTWADSLVASSPRSLRIPAVRLTRARAYLAAGRPAVAVEEGRLALPDADGAELRWVIARALLGLERPGEAALELEQLLAAFPADPLAASAWDLRLSLARTDSSLALDPGGLIRLAGGLLTNPLIGAEAKLRALAEDRGEDLDVRRQAALVLGRALYRAKRYRELVSLVTPWVHDPERADAEECRFILARSYRNSGLISPMEVEYRTLMAAGSDRSPLAAWELGREYESIARWSAAESLYTEFLDRFPESPRVGDAHFRRGFVRVREGKDAEGREDFRAAYQLSRDPSQTEQAAFWLARTLQALGDEKGARETAQAAATAPEPASGYGVLLRERFLGSPAATDSAETPLTPDDPVMIESDFGWPEPIVLYFRRGTELARLGVLDAARREWRQAADLGGEDPTVLQALAISAASASLYPEGAKWGQRADDFILVDAPLARPLRRLAFPVPYFDLVARESAHRGVDPLTIWALMRQESFYDPLAVSKAGALGLLQVMPATLFELPLDGEAPLPPEALLVPRTNVAVGTRWFAERLAAFDQELLPTLASYNAGEAKCREWLERAGGDSGEVFLECIGYPETYDYVRRIIWLRWLYGAYYRGIASPARGSGG